VASQDGSNIMTTPHQDEWDVFREDIREVWEVFSVGKDSIDWMLPYNHMEVGLSRSNIW
jgi:hypothetical protein